MKNFILMMFLACLVSCQNFKLDLDAKDGDKQIELKSQGNSNERPAS